MWLLSWIMRWIEAIDDWRDPDWKRDEADRTPIERQNDDDA